MAFLFSTQRATIITWLIVALCVFFGIYVANRLFFKKELKKPFKTEKPQRRNVQQIINASGVLEIKGNLRIGSIVTGTVQEILVEENDKVKKGQILAIIDNGKADTDVKQAAALLENYKAELTYQKNFYDRQKKLHQTQQISDDQFEQYTRDYLQAEANVKQAQASLEKNEIQYGNTRIKAPDDGIIINVGITIGELLSIGIEATELFEIGKDITQMEAKLEIDESDVGHVKKGQSVKFTVDTHPDRIFKGTIREIGFSLTKKRDLRYYKSVIEVDNSELLLRPGMTVNAKIKVAKAKNVLTVTHQMLQIDSELLKDIAKKINYQFIPIIEAKKKLIKKESGQHQIKYVWVVKDKSFIEKAIKIDVTDDVYFEVKSGLEEHDEVIVDLEEPDEMQKIYKKWFSGAF
jgi:HlyD family secretion protein